MNNRLFWLFCFLFLLFPLVQAQPSGGIRGIVKDEDFDVPLPAAKVSIAETGEEVAATDEGNYVFGEVTPGSYTLVFSKAGYTRDVKADVVVSAGQMTDVNASLSGEFTEMEEFVVQDLNLGGSSEAGLLNLKMDSSSIMDAVGSDMMSKAGASDVAGALKLISGASVQGGKYAVVRGMGDRYTVALLNGVRLPTADPEKRAVHMDLFPSSFIDNIQVSKTFTPDQQGDASGGSIQILPKKIPENEVLSLKAKVEYNTEITGNNDFKLHDGDRLGFTGDLSDYDLPGRWADYFAANDNSFQNKVLTDSQFREKVLGLTENLSHTVGSSSYTPDPNTGFSVAAGNSTDVSGWRAGVLGTFKWDHKFSGYVDATDNDYDIGGAYGPFLADKKAIDADYGKEEVAWAGSVSAGVEREDLQRIGLTYFYSRVTEDKVRSQYIEEYDSDGDPTGVTRVEQDINPVQRDTSTLQLDGKHTLEGMDHLWKQKLFSNPVISWQVSKNFARQYEPDHRTFQVNNYESNQDPDEWSGVGLTRNWLDVEESSDQYRTDFSWPFTLWSEKDGAFKAGLFSDKSERTLRLDSLSLVRGRGDSSYTGDTPWWEDYFDSDNSGVYDTITVGTNEFVLIQNLMRGKSGPLDVDGIQEINAHYLMAEMPVLPRVDFVGGARWESAKIENTFSTIDPVGNQLNTVYFENGRISSVNHPVPYSDMSSLNASIEESRVLPTLGCSIEPVEKLYIRMHYSKTLAYPTFKEITPIYWTTDDSDDIFVGNPTLMLPEIKNYDLRLEWLPAEGEIFSISLFYKDVKDVIDRAVYYSTQGQAYIYPANYDKGEIRGIEFEARKNLGFISHELSDFSIGGNVTLLEATVTVPDEDLVELKNKYGSDFEAMDLDEREMYGQPEYLFNLYLVYDNDNLGTSVGVFLNTRGEALVTGESVGNDTSSNIKPAVYESPYSTLNITASQRIFDNWKLSLGIKNILDPKIEEKYVSAWGDEEIKTSYRKGVTFSLSLGYTF